MLQRYSEQKYIKYNKKNDENENFIWTKNNGRKFLQYSYTKPATINFTPYLLHSYLKWKLEQLQQTLIAECDKRTKESAGGIQNLSNVCFIVGNINRTSNNAIRIVLSETVLPLYRQTATSTLPDCQLLLPPDSGSAADLICTNINLTIK